MSPQFIELTEDGEPVIIGIAHISFFKADINKTGTDIYLNFAHGQNNFARRIGVSEDYETVKEKLGIKPGKSSGGDKNLNMTSNFL